LEKVGNRFVIQDLERRKNGLLILGIATSIDALAVDLGFALLVYIGNRMIET
jgi:putative Mn2+ efflux pump MntP